jgi:hypothetical protein
VKYALGFAAKAPGEKWWFQGSSKTAPVNLPHHQSTRQPILKGAIIFVEKQSLWTSLPFTWVLARAGMAEEERRCVSKAGGL